MFQIYMLVALFIFPFLKERTLNSSLLRTFFFFFLFPRWRESEFVWGWGLAGDFSLFSLSLYASSPSTVREFESEVLPSLLYRLILTYGKEGAGTLDFCNGHSPAVTITFLCPSERREVGVCASETARTGCKGAGDGRVWVGLLE